MRVRRSGVKRRVRKARTRKEHWEGQQLGHQERDVESHCLPCHQFLFPVFLSVLERIQENSCQAHIFGYYCGIEAFLFACISIASIYMHFMTSHLCIMVASVSRFFTFNLLM